MPADTQNQDIVTSLSLSGEAKALELLHGGKPSPSELAAFKMSVQDNRSWDPVHQRDLVNYADMTVGSDESESTMEVSGTRESPWKKARSVTDDNILKKFDVNLDSLTQRLLTKAQQDIPIDPSWDLATQQIYGQMVASLKSNSADDVIKKQAKTDLIESLGTIHGFTVDILTAKLDELHGIRTTPAVSSLPVAQPT